MYCEQCGKEIADSSDFCRHCGTRVKGGEEGLSKASASGGTGEGGAKNDFEEKKHFSDNAAADNSSKQKSGFFKKIHWAAIVVVVPLLIFGVYSLNKTNDKNTPVNPTQTNHANAVKVPVVSDQDVYHFKNKYNSNLPVKNIEITQTEKGVFTYKKTSEDFILSFVLNNKMLGSAKLDDVTIDLNKKTTDISTTQSEDFIITSVIADVRGANNISIRMSPQVGYTPYAGLNFKNDLVVKSIWDDGAIEVNIEGIEAQEENGGKIWVSKKVKYKDKEAILMVAKQ
jgi:hypothetical protein